MKNNSSKNGAENTGNTWESAVQLYRAWKSADLASYRAQGEFTLCAMRGGKYRIAEKSAAGKAIALWSAKQGWATLRGQLAADKKSIQAGLFVLSLDGLKNLRIFADETALAKFISGEGQDGEKFHANFKGMKVLAGAKYSFVSDGRKVWRWETNTCARGAAYFAGTFKA